MIEMRRDFIESLGYEIPAFAGMTGTVGMMGICGLPIHSFCVGIEKVDRIAEDLIFLISGEWREIGRSITRVVFEAIFGCL
jgi:hypothetical protein